MKPFRLYEPTTIDETVATLNDQGDEVKLYAGGTELLLAMKTGLLQYDGLVNVKSVPELEGVSFANGTLIIGARATHTAVELSPDVLTHAPLIASVEHRVANVRVRNVGTVVGNLCFAEPHSDPGALLLLYAAEVDIASPSGTRSASVEELVVGPYETSLAVDELVTRVRVPVLPNGMRGAYMKFGYHHRPTLGVGAAVSVVDGKFADVRLTLGSVPPQPMRLRDAEVALRGAATGDGAATSEAGRIAAEACDAIDDLHGTAEYKRHLVQVFVQRALTEAVERGVK
jgi:aerobic carbon-monoxide dehydrogenase medium subunit